MADKDKKDNQSYRKVDQPKADSLFFNPNTMDELLENLADFEDFGQDDNFFQDDNGLLKIEKHEPYDDAIEAKVVDKKADKADTGMIKKDVPNLDEKTIQDILEDYLDYEKYLGIINHELPKVKDKLVDTEEAPKGTEPKIASK